ncbi:DsbA family oxidoreductase [Albirhodobacter sp. R86504]|uniref:DsbA family oxidoreductase n=1 Tax=Albirhodobacter sp. R86504 TaxID=3093848 RepID=UPI00366BD396
MISLDIFADPVCPFCYLGYGNLRHALKSVPVSPFEIHWHPFQLNPQIAKGGIDRRAYVEGQYGSKAKAVEAHVPVLKMAAEIDLPLDLGAVKRTPNTMDAHRLVYWAGLDDRATPMMEVLLAAYWAEGRDIGDTATLIELFERAGGDPKLAERLLAGDADCDAMRARESHARERGISAVPTFILDNAHAISGAQPVTLWRQVLDDLAGLTFEEGDAEDREPPNA